jgi:hypothetical protein
MSEPNLPDLRGIRLSPEDENALTGVLGCYKERHKLRVQLKVALTTLQSFADTKPEFSDSDRSSADSYYYCPHCKASMGEAKYPGDPKKFKHKPECPVVLAVHALTLIDNLGKAQDGRG